MEKRYDLFEASGTKNIAGYNLYLEKKNENLPDSEKIKKLIDKLVSLQV